VPDFTTEDWVSIHPAGGVARGRGAVLAAFGAVHNSFLRGVTATADSIDVRFATADVAVATVASRLTTYVTPDGVRHENERHISTFVLVRQRRGGGGWRIMQDQNAVRLM
jgi:uncharacterized protein (TIGR02246 family)